MHGELAKLGISISQAAVSKYMVRHRTPPSHTWRSFLDNHANDLVSLDFFTLPTATFRVLFVFIVLRHERRRIVHFNVTEHPSAEWTAQQMVDAFPWDTAPRYLVRDRDQTYGAYFDTRVDGLGIEQVLTAPRSPWQNPLVERMIGSIRRECLDHVIVLDERRLKRILRKYVDYYHSCRTHLSLEKDAPEPRRVESPAMGKVRAIPKVGGLHHYLHSTRRCLSRSARDGYGTSRQLTPIPLSRVDADPRNVLHEDDPSILVAGSSLISRSSSLWKGQASFSGFVSNRDFRRTRLRQRR